MCEIVYQFFVYGAFTVYRLSGDWGLLMFLMIGIINLHRWCVAAPQKIKQSPNIKLSPKALSGICILNSFYCCYFSAGTILLSGPSIWLKGLSVMLLTVSLVFLGVSSRLILLKFSKLHINK